MLLVAPVGNRFSACFYLLREKNLPFHKVRGTRKSSSETQLRVGEFLD